MSGVRLESSFSALSARAIVKFSSISPTSIMNATSAAALYSPMMIAAIMAMLTITPGRQVEAGEDVDGSQLEDGEAADQRRGEIEPLGRLGSAGQLDEEADNQQQRIRHRDQCARGEKETAISLEEARRSHPAVFAVLSFVGQSLGRASQVPPP